MASEDAGITGSVLHVVSLLATLLASVGGALMVVGRALAKNEVTESRVTAQEKLLEAKLTHMTHLQEQLALVRERMVAVEAKLDAMLQLLQEQRRKEG